MSKENEYFQKILNQVRAMFEDDCDNYINPDELAEGDNATDFFHALATLMPCYMYTNLSGEEVDMLGFHHIANRIIVQKSTQLKEGNI
jgi:hypothetical protein